MDKATASALRPLGDDVAEALDHLNVPSYLIDDKGYIRWINPAASALVGDVRGRRFTSVVAPEDIGRARELFARKLLQQTVVTDASVTLIGVNGGRVGVDISSVPVVHGGHVVGVFGQVSDIQEEPVEHPELHLTPRQSEVLRMLERGRSTAEIADELHLSRETVRNHVRHLLRAVGARSRLEAVAVARAHTVTT
jgi:PAS domain S-box-containing protein